MDQSKQKNSRWHSGSGIYRHVWLNVAGPVHIAPWGVFVTTPEVSTERAKVAIQTRIANESASKSKVVLRAILYARSGGVVGQSSASAELEPGDSITASQEIGVEKPALWSPESPNLYRAVTRVIQDGDTVDEISTPFGVRSLEWSAEKGLLLNGTPVKMAGGCIHHDHGPPGYADNGNDRYYAASRIMPRRFQFLLLGAVLPLTCTA